MIDFIVQHKYFIGLAERIHKLVFKRPAGEAMKDFARDLSWSLVGFVFSAFVLFSINILAGRFLGPIGYGEYSLVLIIANFISMPILLGSNITTTKFLAESKNNIEKNRILSNSILLVSFSSILFLEIFILLYYFDFFRIAQIDAKLALVALLFAIFLSYRTLLDGIAKGLNSFQYQTKIRIVESIVVAATFFLLFFILKLNNYHYYALSLIGGMAVFCAMFFLKIRNRIYGWNAKHFTKVSGYMRNTLILTAVVTAINYADRIFVGKFIGISELGMYSAYLTSSSVFVGQIILILNNVFFPAIASLNDKSRVKHQIDRLLVVFAIPATFFFFFTTYTAMSFFGGEFEKNMFLVALFSCAATLQLFGSMYKSLASSRDETYGRYKELSYTLPILIAVLYGLIAIFNLKTLYYVTIAYVVFVSYNFCIIRLSCNYEKK